MNGRKLFRDYAREKHGKQANEFVQIDSEWYNQDKLITKDGQGRIEECTIDYKEMVHWMIRKFPNDDKMQFENE